MTPMGTACFLVVLSYAAPVLILSVCRPMEADPTLTACRVADWMLEQGSLLLACYLLLPFMWFTGRCDNRMMTCILPDVI